MILTTANDLIFLFNRTLTGTTFPGQSEHGSNGNERVLHITKIAQSAAAVEYTDSISAER